MKPILYALLGSFVVAAILCVLWVNAMDRNEHLRAYKPTRRQRRAWQREQLVLPRAVVNRRRP